MIHNNCITHVVVRARNVCFLKAYGAIRQPIAILFSGNFYITPRSVLQTIPLKNLSDQGQNSPPTYETVPSKYEETPSAIKVKGDCTCLPDCEWAGQHHIPY